MASFHAQPCLLGVITSIAAGCIRLRLTWCHLIDCCMTYFPNDAVSHVMTACHHDHISAAAFQTSHHAVNLGDDCKFVEDIALKRHPFQGNILNTGGSPQHPVGRRPFTLYYPSPFAAAVPPLVRYSKMWHLGGRRYTIFSRSSASRIHRLYVLSEVGDLVVGSCGFCGA